MSSTQFARFTGARAMPGPPLGHGAGVCKSCGCHSAACGCGCRQCRTEAKEITVTGKAGDVAGGLGNLVGAHLAATGDVNAVGTTTGGPTPVTAFVGGGCCVHISVEYAPVAVTAQSRVAVIVRDTEGTLMAWEKTDPPGTHYQIKENVVTTKPGATILLFAVNATVRARWCEVFSC